MRSLLVTLALLVGCSSPTEPLPVEPSPTVPEAGGSSPIVVHPDAAFPPTLPHEAGAVEAEATPEAAAPLQEAEAVAHVEIEAGAGRHDFTIDGHAAFLIRPTLPAAGSPWVWYAPTIAAAALPGDQEIFYFGRFTAAGIAVAGIDVGESYGNPEGRALFSRLYDELSRGGMSARPCFLARSRGGLQAYNWAAEHPTSVGCIAGIYPVGDLASWPGLATAAPAYGMSVEAMTAALPANDPIDRLAPIAGAHVPLWHIHGDVDTTVPIEQNSAEVHRRYLALGGPMTLVVASGHGHDYWPGFFTSEELVSFVLENAR